MEMTTCISYILFITLYFGNTIVASRVIDDRLPDCKEWNATILVQRNSIRKEIGASFRVFDEFEDCFKSFHVFLSKVRDNDCNDGFEIDRYLVTTNKQLKSALFRNVENGSYCIKIRPLHEKCQYFYELCSVLNSNIVSIGSVEIPTTTTTESPTPPPVITKVILATALVSFFMCIIIAIAAVFYWRYKGSNDRMITAFTKDPEIAAAFSNTYYRNQSVLILHTFESRIKQYVKILAAFLRQELGINVILADEQRYLIDINDVAWMSEQLHYECNKLGEFGNERSRNRKIIIVESERVASFQGNQNAIRDIEDCDIPLDELFFYGLSLLSPKKKLEDYCHIFVIRFPEMVSPKKKLDSLVPDCRYTLPDKLIDLCVDLLSPEGNWNNKKVAEDMLKTKIMQSTYYKNILQLLKT